MTNVSICTMSIPYCYCHIRSSLLSLNFLFSAAISHFLFTPMQLHAPQPNNGERATGVRVNFGGQIPNSIEILSFGSFFCCYWPRPPPLPLRPSFTILWLYFSNYTSLPFVVPAWNCHFPTFSAHCALHFIFFFFKKANLHVMNVILLVAA